MRCQQLSFMLTVVVTLSCAAAACSKKKGTQPENGGAERIRWAVPLAPGIYYGSPTLDPAEQTVYFGTSLPFFAPTAAAHRFVALVAETGAQRWSVELGGEMRSTPAIAPDSSIYFMMQGFGPGGIPADGDLLCHLGADGSLLWTQNINPGNEPMEVGLSAPAIGLDGSVYVAGDQLYAFRPDGTVKWRALTPTYEAMRNSPVVGPNGTVYFAYHNVPLTALDPEDGSVLWSCPLGVNDHCLASPAIAADGTIVVATNPGIVYAVSPAGAIQWTFDIASAGFRGFLRSSPAVDADGAIYFGINYGDPSSALFALSGNGTLRWIFQPSDLPPDTPADHFDIYSSPAIGSDGTIYFGQEFGRVYALDPSGSTRWIVETRSGITWSSPALSADGTLYISDLEGNCYAISTESRGLKADAPWAKYRANNQCTGHAGGLP